MRSIDLGLRGALEAARLWRNLSVAELYEHAVRRNEAVIAAGGPLLADTGDHTGRSPKDKFLVKEPATSDQVWWGSTNRPADEAAFASLLEKVRAYVADRELYVFDGYAGADPQYRLPLRVVTERAWHSLFAYNMFLREPDRAKLETFVPDAHVIDLPGLLAEPATDGTRSSTFILVHLAERLVLIGGTEYAGEIKKSIFGLLKYLLPQQGVLSMHCSANYGRDRDDVALFFGLSGTGKTTLSADPKRTLIGDDEHGWSDHGIFNFEGGCYAKVIKLRRDTEPEIYATTERFGTVLENVVYDPVTRELDLDDASKTENTRSCYPITQLDRVDLGGVAGHPKKHRLPHLRRVRRDAADRSARLSAGDVPLPLRLHRESGGHRTRRDRAAGDLQHLLRGAVHAAAPAGLRAHAGREDARARRQGVAHQHRLDRRSARSR